MENRLYVMNVDALNDDEMLQAAYDCLSRARRDKAERLAFRRDRNLSLGAGLLLDHALRALGLREKEMRFGVRENRKPFLPELPEFHFNLSHSGSMALCAVSDREVGCDIQVISALRLSVARRGFTERECADVLSRPTEAERTALFFRYWTWKESYMKYTGLGLALRPDAFEIRIAPTGVAILRNGEVQPVSLTAYSAIPGYACAVCVPAGAGALPLQWVTAAQALEAAGGGEAPRLP